MPHLGENAMAKMVKVLSRLEDLQRIPEDPLEEMTLCIDTIKGGTRINVIPEDCEVEIDVRYPPDMTAESVLQLVREQDGSDGYEVRILHQLDPVETDPMAPAGESRSRRSSGAGRRSMAVPYATEMVMFKAGNPVLMVCGPGDPKLATSRRAHDGSPRCPRPQDIYVEVLHSHGSEARRLVQASLRVDPGDGPRERYRVPDVVELADPGDYPLDAQTETGVRHGAVLPQVQVPLVVLHALALSP